MAVAALLFSLTVGSASLSMAQLWGVVQGQGDALARTLVVELRLPRALSAFAVGGGSQLEWTELHHSYQEQFESLLEDLLGKAQVDPTLVLQALCQPARRAPGRPRTSGRCSRNVFWNRCVCRTGHAALWD